MVKTKKIKKTILLLYLAIFSLGQIPGLIITLSFKLPYSIHITDILAFLFVLTSCINNKTFLKNYIRTDIFKFVVIISFSYVFGMLFFSLLSLNSFLYLLRALTYLTFAYVLWKERILSNQEITTFFVVNAFIISLFGLAQYTLLPDTRFLKILGWDDHYFRLISTFLDPAFTGILLVLSLLFMGIYWKPKSNLFKSVSICIVFVALLLTYSRASYLSLFIGIIIYGISQQKIKLKYLLLLLIFVLSLFFLPRPDGSEGVKLERTFSVVSKFQNTSQLFEITKKSPLFGFGYNNLCFVKNIHITTQSNSLFSHSCSGADNSIIFIFSTMGIMGLLFVTWGGFQLIKSSKSPLMFSVFAAVLLHTQFTNTIFYPWVFIWLVLCSCLLPITAKK